MPTDTWICLGGGPSAPAMLPVAMVDYPGATTITSNSGIKLIEPDYYYLVDRVARKDFGEQAKRARENGTMIITRDRAALEADGIPVDEDISNQPWCDYSGQWCAQFALRNGATTLALVGHEGYHPTPGTPLHWDGERPCPIWLGEETPTHLAPWWRKTIAAWPCVTFHFYGELNYELIGPNVIQTVTT